MCEECADSHREVKGEGGGGREGGKGADCHREVKGREGGVKCVKRVQGGEGEGGRVKCVKRVQGGEGEGGRGEMCEEGAGR